MIRFAQPLNLSGVDGSEGFSVLSVDGVGGVTYLLQVKAKLVAIVSQAIGVARFVVTGSRLKKLGAAAGVVVGASAAVQRRLTRERDDHFPRGTTVIWPIT